MRLYRSLCFIIISCYQYYDTVGTVVISKYREQNNMFVLTFLLGIDCFGSPVGSMPMSAPVRQSWPHLPVLFVLNRMCWRTWKQLRSVWKLNRRTKSGMATRSVVQQHSPTTSWKNWSWIQIRIGSVQKSYRMFLIWRFTPRNNFMNIHLQLSE